MPDKITVLILGDVFGNPGVRALFVGLKSLVKQHRPDAVIVNGENAAAGRGISLSQANQLFSLGVNVITSGNHIWQQKEIYDLLNSDQPILRPANYPPGVPGKGYVFIEAKKQTLAVLNLQGRREMQSIDCPFRTGKEIVRKIRDKTKLIIADFHAESTEEKEALALYLDGQVSAVVGTHTHIQTADEKILPNGTAYISDIGMTGPEDSVIGSVKEVSVQRSLTQMPIRMEASDNPAAIEGIKLELDAESGKAVSIERLRQHSMV